MSHGQIVPVAATILDDILDGRRVCCGRPAPGPHAEWCAPVVRSEIDAVRVCALVEPVVAAYRTREAATRERWRDDATDEEKIAALEAQTAAVLALRDAVARLSAGWPKGRP